MPIPKKSREAKPPFPLSCGARHPDTGYLCTRPRDEDHSIHVAVGETTAVLAAWSDDLMPSMALNRAKVNFYTQLTLLLHLAEPLIAEAIGEASEDIAQRRNRKS